MAIAEIGPSPYPSIIPGLLVIAALILAIVCGSERFQKSGSRRGKRFWYAVLITDLMGLCIWFWLKR